MDDESNLEDIEPEEDDDNTDLSDAMLFGDEDDFDDFEDDTDDYELTTSSAPDSIETILDNMLDVASVEAVYGVPVEHRDSLIIPAAEVITAMGFGMGMGTGEQPAAQANGAPPSSGSGSGGGGGGTSRARPVAVIISGPDGVRVEPVFDLTKIALAGMTVGIFFLGMLGRIGRMRGRMRKIHNALED